MKIAKLKNPDIKIYCDITKCVGCCSCEIACAVEHSKSKNIFSAVREKPLPKKRVKTESVDTKIIRLRQSRNSSRYASADVAIKGSISLHCQHCEDAPCVKACMSGALSKDAKTGATLHDKEKCVGCWMCVMVCPFGAIVRDVENHIAVKCDLCPDRDDYTCVVACPTGALFSGTKKEFEKKIKKK